MSESTTGSTAGSGSESGQFSKEKFPELNEGQRATLRQGGLPGQIKLQAITLMIASLALILAIVGIVV